MAGEDRNWVGRNAKVNQEVRNLTAGDTLDQQHPLEIIGLSGFLGP